MEMNLIYNRAWSFHRTTGLELQELLSEATLAYLEAERTYSSTSVKFTTYAYTCINNRLTSYCEEWKKHSIIEDPYEKMDWNKSICHIGQFMELNMGKFSKPIREMMTIIFESQDDYDLNFSRKNRGAIVQLLKSKGWPWEKIWKSFDELKNLLKQIPENELF